MQPHMSSEQSDNNCPGHIKRFPFLLAYLLGHESPSIALESVLPYCCFNNILILQRRNPNPVI